MTANTPPMVACPTCRKPVAWIAAEAFKPFCSERCKLIDLGDWATEAHKIPGPPLLDEDEESSDFESY
ncbi:DNA gyrase inhibitor YacG [Methylomonas sp. 2BW1-5-20]|uniref:DNA gyrase inhibitor YacG n=1 Tax=Methylomonas sp. 2BW1-5-20 TaxID=3376686 RepID=UPI00404CC185